MPIWASVGRTFDPGGCLLCSHTRNLQVLVQVPRGWRAPHRVMPRIFFFFFPSLGGLQPYRRVDDCQRLTLEQTHLSSFDVQGVSCSLGQAAAGRKCSRRLMPREGKHKKKSKPHRQRSAKPQRVLRYAALGKSSKLARLFTESLPSDLGLFASEGNTALHLAAQHGHKDTAALLVRCACAAVLCWSRFTRFWLLPASLLPLLSEAHLSWLCRQGAECKAENFAGNTPAHLAAMHGHAAILTILLQVRGGGRCVVSSSFCYVMSTVPAQTCGCT